MKTYTLIVGDEDGLRGEESYEEMIRRKTAPMTSEQMKTRRTRLGMSRNQLALLVGCSAVYIQKMEQGDRRISLSMNQKLKRVFEEEEQKLFPEG